MLADLITKLETRIDASVTRGNGCVLLGKVDAARMLRLLRAGEKAVECLFVLCVECGGRGAFSDADDLAVMCQRCGGAGRYPMDDDCTDALREWDEAGK